ncbi:hypothetical protein LOK49_LG07G01206 [Camellia lanceoleosa]|uniref:Uncharacterized protein n=1 Tax=Camellia lanceoleosa TaxID=1840588 RepID=A0ACC0HAB9_9ERIC|nr:hypothetical protein LOK49_LG07G01206 [Camellia lanceoleosa]
MVECMRLHALLPNFISPPNPTTAPTLLLLRFVLATFFVFALCLGQFAPDLTVGKQGGATTPLVTLIIEIPPPNPNQYPVLDISPNKPPSFPSPPSLSSLSLSLSLSTCRPNYNSPISLIYISVLRVLTVDAKLFNCFKVPSLKTAVNCLVF